MNLFDVQSDLVKMLLKKLLQCCTATGSRRFISQTVQKFESKSADSAVKNAESNKIPGRSLYIPNSFDKWLLVWVKKYPKGQVPEKITEEVIYQAKGKARVKAAIIMMIGTMIMCFVSITQAKKMVREGDSIQRRQDEWRAKVIEEGKKELNK